TRHLTRRCVSRLLKNYFQQPDRAAHGGAAHFSNTQVFEKWSKAKTAFFALRAEKATEGFFSILLDAVGLA
ncbi:MAG: hypothetical protein V3V96_17860, partial [Acidiferrobacterales bacterium]